MAHQISVVDPRYCDADEIEAFLLTLQDRSILVANIRGNINLIAKKVRRESRPSLRMICGADKIPIVTLKRKVPTAHGRWKVFRGDIRESRDLIFTVKRHSIFDLRTNLDVFLANNTAEKEPDFRIEGRFSQNICTIYAGRDIIAEVQRANSENINTLLRGKNNFKVTINSNIDHIFIIALIVILEKTSPTFKFTYAMAAMAASSAVSILRCINDGSSSS